MIRENTIDMFTILYVKQILSGDLLYDSEKSTSTVAYDGAGNGREFQKGVNICISMVNSC